MMAGATDKLPKDVAEGVRAETDRMSAKEIAADWLADIAELAVPLEMHSLRHTLPEARQELARSAVTALSELGDALLMGKPGSPGMRTGYKAFITAMAVLALDADGGANYRDKHWCARKHKNCPNMEAK